ncbi:FAD dependent oxidoreductase [Cercophora newfieldiana]|uniref:FAD dependent oxidoreductase n=1 Tax=Cercophora newfieldiana TaxID=92897 RepID=A0AA39XSH5_9PEZI|nr:FAD dependent oxidoreductase [Cercophora newfieldiana]
MTTQVPGQAGLPSPNPSKSYWLQDPSNVLIGHRSTQELPDTADVIIIGSGITGAFAAHFLKRGVNADGVGVRGGESLVMLEAREACFGATGRNGGHCQPFLYGNAPAVAEFELENYRFLRDLVSSENIPCDWVDVTGVHGYLTPTLFNAAAATAERLKASHPHLAEGIDVVQPHDTKRLRELRVPTVAGAIIQPRAASLWPYKLVSHILERLLRDFDDAVEFNLQTCTPVTSLTRLNGETALNAGGWKVHTPRGTITTPKILLATNGYTSHILPAMTDLIVPVRGQISSLLPTGIHDVPVPRLPHSYVFASQQTDSTPWRDDYMVQRPLSRGGTANQGGGGEFIFGGGRGLAANKGIAEYKDDEVEGAVAEFLRTELCPPLDLTTAQSGTQLKATFSWTGIMGYSRDAHPWVGPVPSRLGGGEGMFVCAGYTGHGMPNGALCARAVVGMMRGTDAKGGLPGSYVVSEERVERVRKGDTIQEAQEKDVWAEAFPELGFIPSTGC